MVGDNPLGKVVAALEALPSRDREVAAVPERLEHHLRRLPVPHPAAALPFEVARAERPFLADAGQHGLDEVGMLAQRAVVGAPVAAALHDGPEVGPELDRQQRRLVRPVLEDPPLTEQPRDRVARVGADAHAERQPVRAVDRRDRVELHRRQPADRRLDVCLVAAPKPHREPLASDDEPPHGGQRNGHLVSLKMWPRLATGQVTDCYIELPSRRCARSGTWTESTRTCSAIATRWSYSM